MITLRRWWRQFVVIIVGALVATWWRARRRPENVRVALKETDAKVNEAKHLARLRVLAARAQDAAVKAKLREVVRIKDGQKRRAALLKIYEDLS